MFILSQNIISQSNKTEKIFWDIIDYKLYPETCSEIGYVNQIKGGMYSNHLDKFKSDSSLVYYEFKYKNEKVDSIILTVKEKEYLTSELSKPNEFDWNLSDEKNLKQVDEKDILEFLKRDRNRELKIISKPIFIRNKNIICLFTTHLCCGHILGHSSLSFYRKENNKWLEWIPISAGSY
jgi:hypothetical protein